jgi:hypothetical protein
MPPKSRHPRLWTHIIPLLFLFRWLEWPETMDALMKFLARQFQKILF